LKKSIILADCDDTMFEWINSYIRWMALVKKIPMVAPHMSHTSDMYGFDDIEFVREFNEGFVDEQLPFKDAGEIVKQLYEEGYVFHVITSFGDDPKLKARRADRLRKVFGPAIWEIDVLNYGASKEDALLRYHDTGMLWVEDNVTHYDTGVRLGLNSVLMNNGHNVHDVVEKRVYCWNDLLHREGL
jgi:hypothetical protein